jgi:hypothetical protein
MMFSRVLRFGWPALLVLVVVPALAGVIFEGLDVDTSGDWCGVYGDCIYILPGAEAGGAGIEYPIVNGDSSSYDLVGGARVDDLLSYRVYTRFWYADPRSLESPDERTRRATTLFSVTDRCGVDLRGLPAGDYRLSVYLLDYEGGGRVELVALRNGIPEAAQVVTGFESGVYLRFLVSVAGPGDELSLELQDLGPGNAVVSGVFLDPASPFGGGVQFEGEDWLTAGDWVGAYGSLWYLLLGQALQPDIPDLPPSLWETPTWTVRDDRDVVGGGLFGLVEYDTLGGRFSWEPTHGQELGNAAAWIWPTPWDGAPDPYTEDPRALLIPDQCVDRIPATWDDLWEESPPLEPGLRVSFSVAIDSFQLALYLLDFEDSGRAETIRVVDSGGVLLAEAAVSSFAGGVYALFRFDGVRDFELVLEHTAGLNSVLSGVFFSECSDYTPTPTVAPSPTPEPSPTPAPSPTPEPTFTFVPAPCEPRTPGYWKLQCRKQQHEDPAPYFPVIADLSAVFDEVGDASCERMLAGGGGPMLKRALWHTLALWLNVVSGKLSFATPVDEPGLTDAANVGEAIAEIEALILNGVELERAKDIADAINNGWALACGEPPPTWTPVLPEPTVTPPPAPPTATPAPEPTATLPPAPCEPRTPGYWKLQCRKQQHEDPAPYFPVIADLSTVFDEVGDASCERMLAGGGGPILKRALWHTLALWLNIASGKLSFATPVDEPALTAAVNVGEAIAEIEALILDGVELERAKDIADVINNSWALPCR